jgi:hypothetical protein
MDCMSAFVKAPLVPELVVGISVQYIYCRIFKPVPRHHIRRRK